MHAAETAHEQEYMCAHYGCTLGDFLEDQGIIGPRTTLAHGVHWHAADYTRLAQTKTGIVHCPTSNMKLASGVAPVVELLQQGCLVGLGTDGAASNNSLDIVAEMKLAALLQRARLQTTTALDAYTVIELATCKGAQALHIDHKVGSLEQGKCADIITIGMDRFHQLPAYDYASTLVYASCAHDVRTVLVQGVPLLRDGQFVKQELLQSIYQHTMAAKAQISLRR
jgi:5-methylthioadenosine/S-adenosylhomocysteine deaminase